jgi:hypothetical protein
MTTTGAKRGASAIEPPARPTIRTTADRRAAASRQSRAARWMCRSWRPISNERLRAETEWEAGNFVFTNSVGRPLSAHTVARWFRRLCATAGVTTPHRLYDCRHTAATLLLGQGVHPRVVMEVLGHSTFRLTMDTYTHVLPVTMREAAELPRQRFDGAWRPQTRTLGRCHRRDEASDRRSLLVSFPRRRVTSFTARHAGPVVVVWSSNGQSSGDDQCRGVPPALLPGETGSGPGRI